MSFNDKNEFRIYIIIFFFFLQLHTEVLQSINILYFVTRDT